MKRNRFSILAGLCPAGWCGVSGEWWQIPLCGIVQERHSTDTSPGQAVRTINTLLTLAILPTGILYELFVFSSQKSTQNDQMVVTFWQQNGLGGQLSVQIYKRDDIIFGQPLKLHVGDIEFILPGESPLNWTPGEAGEPVSSEQAASTFRLSEWIQ